MSRRIDFTKPLSSEEAEYVAQRPWMEDNFRLSYPDAEIYIEDPEADEDEDPEDSADYSKLTRAELFAKLQELGVEDVSSDTKHGDLVELVEATLEELEEDEEEE